MQYRYSLSLKKDTRELLGSLFRWAVFIIVAVYLYSHLSESRLILRAQWFPLPWMAWAAFLLMPLNWGLETAKWKFILSRTEIISWDQAARGVLYGLAFGLITPRALGDYAGRLMTLKTSSRLEYAGPLMISRVSQLMITLMAGSFGVFLLSGPVPAFLSLFSGPLVLTLSFLAAKYWKFPGRRHVAVFLAGLKHLTTRDILYIAGFSAGRYAVFALQLILLMTWLTDLSFWLITGGVTWIFLAKSVLPSINFLGDLGLREFSAVYFFTNFEADPIPVVTATLLLWMINIALPSLTGSLLFLKFRRQ